MANVKSPAPLFDTLENHDVKPNLPGDIAPFAVDDYKHASQFLYMYRGSEATFNSYRRELERLLHWS